MTDGQFHTAALRTERAPQGAPNGCPDALLETPRPPALHYPTPGCLRMLPLSPLTWKGPTGRGICARSMPSGMPGPGVPSVNDSKCSTMAAAPMRCACTGRRGRSSASCALRVRSGRKTVHRRLVTMGPCTQRPGARTPVCQMMMEQSARTTLTRHIVTNV